MDNKPTSRGFARVVFAVMIALLMLIPCVFILCRAHEKNAEQSLEFEQRYFSDIAETEKRYLLKNLADFSSQSETTGELLSGVGNKRENIARLLTSSSAVDADAVLVYGPDEGLVYGDLGFAADFMSTAKEANTSKSCAVSDLTECFDGSLRLGFAAPYSEADGETQTVVLLCKRAELRNLFENPDLSPDCTVGIIDKLGRPILCKYSDTWFESGKFSFGNGSLKTETLINVIRTDTGAELTAYAKHLGVNDWLVIIMLPSDTAGLRSAADIRQIYINCMAAVFLLVLLIGFFVFWAGKGARRLELFKIKFRIATSQSARAAFEYNRRTDRLIFISESEHVKLPKPYVSLIELGEYVHPADRPTYYQSVADLRNIGTTSVIVRLINFCGREVYRWYHVTGTRLTDRGEGKALTIGTVEDIDEQENERRLLHEKATTDSLTGLWNRSETEKAVNAQLLKLEKDERSAFALLDLDNFKEINDRHGHDCGDRALVRFSEVLRSTFRFGDVLGRLGGDEFIVYMPLAAEKEIVERRLGELMENLSGSSDGRCEPPLISCSVGCCFGGIGDSFEAMYKRADSALYESKKRGKMQFTIKD